MSANTTSNLSSGDKDLWTVEALYDSYKSNDLDLPKYKSASIRNGQVTKKVEFVKRIPLQIGDFLHLAGNLQTTKITSWPLVTINVENLLRKTSFSPDFLATVLSKDSITELPSNSVSTRTFNYSDDELERLENWLFQNKRAFKSIDSEIESLFDWFFDYVSIRRFKLLTEDCFKLSDLLKAYLLTPLELFQKVQNCPLWLFPLGGAQVLRGLKLFGMEKDYQKYVSDLDRFWQKISSGSTCSDSTHLLEDLASRVECSGMLVPFMPKTGSDNKRLKTGETVMFSKLSDITEKWLVKNIKAKLSHNSQISPPKAEHLEGLSEDQKLAFQQACSSMVCILDGAAGCGKTFLISKIIKYLESCNIETVVCAFTGKAVTRAMKLAKFKRGISFGIPKFCTIHQLRGILKSTQDKEAVEKIKFVIVDEVGLASMRLIAGLIESIPKKANILFVGDSNQLPCIDWFRFLQPLIDSKSVAQSTLTTNHRQGLNGVARIANQILDKKVDALSAPDHFEIIECNPEFTFKKVAETLDVLLKSGISILDIMIVYPFKDTKKLTECIDAVLPRPEKTIKDSLGNTFHVGARVFVKDNGHTLEYDEANEQNFPSEQTVRYYNGEEGIVKKIAEKEVLVSLAIDEFHVMFPIATEKPEPKKMSISIDDVPEQTNKSTAHLKVGYCTTIHKSQGSEWEYVILCLPSKREDTSYQKKGEWKAVSASSGFLNQSMVYTAVTRAKKKCFVVGSSRVFNDAVKTTSVKAKSKLGSRLSNE